MFVKTAEMKGVDCFDKFVSFQSIKNFEEKLRFAGAF